MKFWVSQGITHLARWVDGRQESTENSKALVPGHYSLPPEGLSESSDLSHSHSVPSVIVIICRDFIEWSETRNCSLELGARGWPCMAVVVGPSLPDIDKWHSPPLAPREKWSAGSGPYRFSITTDASLGLYFYFTSALLTWFRTVNQLTARFVAVVPSVIRDAILLLIIHMQSILWIPGTSPSTLGISSEL